MIAVVLAGWGAASVASAEATKVWREPRTGMEFVWIPKGCFQMGADEPGREPPAPHLARLPPQLDELPRHEVCVDGFWLGKHEITRGQWGRLMGPSASPAGKQGRHPVAEVSWDEARELARRLSAAGNARYRLPTEIEWEYACQAGQPPVPYDEDNQQARDQLMESAWYKDSVEGNRSVREVGAKNPNPWGLHDMLGNVWEWVQDEYAKEAYTHHGLFNSSFDKGGARRVIRGGSFQSGGANVRCGQRNYGMSNDRLPVIGFRLVREEGKRP